MKKNLNKVLRTKSFDKAIAIFLVMNFCFLTACSLKDDNEQTPVAIDSLADKSTDTESDSNTDEDSSNLDEEVSGNGDLIVSDTGNGDLGLATYADLSEYVFEFCSGAGGWSTEMYIEKDGYFHGTYHDSDMGDSGDEYPDGTMYISEFTGHFSNLEQISDKVYSFELTDISYQNTPEEEEIIDGTRYIYSVAYGLTGKNFVLYCPGYAVKDFSEEIHSWVDMAVGEDENLSFYVIENSDEEEAFTSYERMAPYEDACSVVSNTENSLDYYNEELNSDEISQLEMNSISMQMYNVCDDSLNYVWTLVKYNLSEEDYNHALDDQRQWLKQRDKEVEEECKDCEGGSIYDQVYYSTMASLTMDRLKVITELLK